MDENNLKVSIITVVKNGEGTIVRCLQSIFNQDYPNIEVLVMDGDSSDETLTVVNSLKNSKIKIHSSPDSGIYEALNAGIVLATGDIIGLLHADDYLNDKYVISRIVNGFHNSKAPILIGRLNYFHPDKPNKVTRRYFPLNFKNWMFRFGMAPPHPAFYAKKELFERYGEYRTDLEIAGDYDLMLRFIEFQQISYQCVADCWVMMSTGGKSTNGLKSILKNNRDILKVCKSHNFYTNYTFIYAKYLIKSIGLIFK